MRASPSPRCSCPCHTTGAIHVVPCCDGGAPVRASRNLIPGIGTPASRIPGVNRCHKQEILIPRIERALGVVMGPTRCYLVRPDAMANVMARHGWSRTDAVGVVGFQVHQDVYVLQTAPWTVLHELVHRAGINADRLNRYVAEGLTEAIAADLRHSHDEHRATYPEETAWVRGTLLPAIGLDAIGLGRRLASAPNPAEVLADLLVARRPGLNRATLLEELRPQRTGRPSLNRSAPIEAPPPGWTFGVGTAVGTALATAGALLLFTPSSE